jgi:hypothetical protein
MTVLAQFRQAGEWIYARLAPQTEEDGGLRALASGARYTDDGVLDYLWFHLEENGREYFKAVCLQLLTFLPREVREQANRMQKVRKALLGLWAARVDPVVVRGVLPEYGAVQLYGAVGTGDKLEDAVFRARQGVVAVTAALSNFEQARFGPVAVDLAEDIRRAFAEMKAALTVVGHPDPREDIVGGVSGGADAQRSVPRSAVGLQQTEYVYRGMVSAGHRFLNVTMFSRVGDGDLQSVYRTRERLAAEASRWLSKVNSTRSATMTVGLPVILSGLLSNMAGTGYGTSEAQSHQTSVGQTVGRAHTEGMADSSFWTKSTTHGEAWGEASTSGSSWGQSISHTTGTTEGTAHTTSEAWGTADTHGSFSSSGSGSSSVVTQGVAMNQSYNVSADALVIKGGGSVGLSQSFAVAHGVSSFSSSGTSDSHTTSHSTGVADTASHSVSQATTVSSFSGGFSSHTTSHSTMESATEGHGGSHVVSRADTTSSATSTMEGRGEATGVVRAQSVGMAQGAGIATGVTPAISLGESWQTVDRVAKMVADALQDMENLLDVIGREGGYYVDNYFLCDSPEAQRVLETLILQAYHGIDGADNVITGIRCRHLPPQEQEYIQLCAQVFTPSNRPERNAWIVEPWRDTSLLSMLQAATYFTPASFEQGPAITVQEQVPPLAFIPKMQGPILLGHQYSYEISTERPTSEPVRMSLDLMSNWAFCADTRMGKSVAAERLVWELVMKGGFRVVVMDYGAGWAKMLNALLPDQVDFWNLAPWGPRPIRWNFLQIGERISPREQMTATVELLCAAGRMGERQAGFMVQTLEELYIDHGVLTFDLEVQSHEKWGVVQDDEFPVLDAVRQKRGLPPLPRKRVFLVDLTPAELQALAVYRSQQADAREWFNRLSALAKTVKDPTSRSALEGVRLRLQHLVKGQMGQMYGAGGGSIAMENLAPPRGGLTILAGGARMSEYARSALLALMTYHLYTDSVVRREERLAGVEYPPLFIVLEEANKVIAGVESGSSGSKEQAMHSDIIPSFFRDAGKYGVYLCAIVQSPSVLPPGILSSCNNIAAGQLKNPDDVKAVMSAMARSPHGFVDVPYAHLLGILEPGKFLLRLGLARDGRGNYPLMYRPLMVDAREPSPAELEKMFGAGDRGPECSGHNETAE